MTTITVKNPANARYVSPDERVILLDVRLNMNGAEVDTSFGASLDDCEAHGRAIYADCKAGRYGPIAPYDPEIYPLPQAMGVTIAIQHK